MSQMPPAKAQRARENSAYVRELLRRRQPGFAVVLASAERCLSHLLTQAGNDVGPVIAHKICHLDGALAGDRYCARSRGAQDSSQHNRWPKWQVTRHLDLPESHPCLEAGRPCGLGLLSEAAADLPGG
jgi:hypothetical protein